MAEASAFRLPTAARIAAASEPDDATSASPSASSVILRYEVRTIAALTTAFPASIPSSLAIVVRSLRPYPLLDSPIDDVATGVAREHRRDRLGRHVGRRLIVGSRGPRR